MANVTFETIKTATYIFDDMHPRSHTFGYWSAIQDHDSIKRRCKVCGYEQRLTGQLLNQVQQAGDKNSARILSDIWELIPVCAAVVPPAQHAAEVEKMLQNAFPGTIEVSEQPPYEILEQEPEIPLELSDDALEAVESWLQADRGEFDYSTAYWERLINVHNPQKIEAQLVETGEIPNSFQPYSIILVRRLPIIFADKRWWMDVAIRMDTGEPIATVNHKGNWYDYFKEVLIK